MEIVAIIPAKKCSKRLPQKNIRGLCGKSLVEHTILQAMESKLINDIYVTTDDKVVMRLADKYGIKYRERPKELCKDDTPMESVLDDMIDWIPWDRKPDIIVSLQPTSPLRTAEDIDKCINYLINGDFDSVISVERLDAFYIFIPNGAVYAIRVGRQRYNDNMGLFTMPHDRSVDIDTIVDFKLAELLMNERNKK